MGEHYEGSLHLTATSEPVDETAVLGRHAYEAYCAATGGVSAVSGQPLPSWDEQAQEIQAAWKMAALAVAREITD